MGSAFFVAKCIKIKQTKKKHICIFDRNLPKNIFRVFQNSFALFTESKRTDCRRLIFNKNPFAPGLGYCIIEYTPSSFIDKEYYWNKLGSLENPSEEEIACYTRIINRLLDG